MLAFAAGWARALVTPAATRRPNSEAQLWASAAMLTRAAALPTAEMAIAFSGPSRWARRPAGIEATADDA